MTDRDDTREALEASGYADGDLFRDESAVRDYFSPSEQRLMFGDDEVDEAMLEAMADLVIAERLHMERGTIPSREAIDSIVAGVNAGSAYHQARHEVWSAIRDHYNDGATLEVLADAIEWAEILDRHVPSQQGSSLEREHFRRLALAEVGR